MDTNAIPKIDLSDCPTGCCPRFHPEGWDHRDLHFRDKPFVRATTRSVMHVPINMGGVFSRVQGHIEDAGAMIDEGYLVLSQDPSAWRGEHLFAVSKRVDGEEMTTISGDFITRVFEGAYSGAKGWYEQMEQTVRERGKDPGRIFFFYTTCPTCAKAYGKNYVVGVAEV